jgi:hypothetical protein
MWRNSFWEWWEQSSGFVIGPILVIAGVVLNRVVVTITTTTHIVDDLSVALFIGGILTMTVDPFVKRKARREATRDIFHHMLGYSLPEIIRERLQEIVERTRFYRKNTTIYINLLEEGDVLVFATEMEFEMFNPTPHGLCFEPHLQFENGEHAELKSVTCFEEADYGKNAVLTATKISPGSLEYRGKGVVIPSQGSRRFKYQYVVKYPMSLGFFYPNFQYPTIGLALTIKSPKSLTVRATPAEFESTGEWRYPNRLFMPHEHIDIVWEKAND